MKKLISILLILTLTFSLTACDFSLDDLKEKIGIKKDDDKESSVIQLKLWTSETTYITAQGDSYCISKNEFWEPGRTSVYYLSVKNTGAFDLKHSIALNAYDITNNIHETILYTILPGTTYGEINSPPNSKDLENYHYILEGTTCTDLSNMTLKSGEELFFAILLHMDTNSGNQYYDGKIKIDVQISAKRYKADTNNSGNNINSNDGPIEGPLIDIEAD